MSDDPLIQRLTQLEPDGGELDRDALLFAAGRASVRPNRGWQRSGRDFGGVAACDVALCFFWPGQKLRRSKGRRFLGLSPTTVAADRAHAHPPPLPVPEGGRDWAFRQQLLEGDGKLPPMPAIELVDLPEENLSEIGPLMFQHFGGAQTMIRLFCGLFLTAICAALSGEGLGQIPPEPKPVAPEPTETVIRLKVQGRCSTLKPVLQYHLLPELSEMNPGNPIQGYLSCFSDQNYFFFNKQSFEDRERWSEMPLKDLPVEKLRGWGYGGHRGCTQG